MKALDAYALLVLSVITTSLFLGQVTGIWPVGWLLVFSPVLLVIGVGLVAWLMVWGFIRMVGWWLR